MIPLQRQTVFALALAALCSACSSQTEPSKAAGTRVGQSRLTSQSPSSLPVFVGYADNLRANGSFPTPWAGAPNTLFLGGCDSVDAGAIRLDNPGAAPLLVDSVVVDLQRPGPAFNLWGSFTIPAGGSAILTQRSCYDFDTSDFPLVGCGVTLAAGDPRVPKITVTAGGSSTDYLDTGHILDTGGYDLACLGNESLQWRPVGTVGSTVTSDTLALAPGNANLPVGATYTATATLLDPSGGRVPNVSVSFAVTLGPDAGRTGSAVTDAQGHAAFSFAGSQIGTDTLVATVANAAGGSFQSDSVTVSWSVADVCPSAAPPGPQAPSLVYLGAQTGEYNDPFALAALLTDGSGTPLAGRSVSFALGAQTAAATTDARGVARAALTPSGTPGATPLTASFPGDATNLPAQVALSAAIAKDQTALRYTGRTALAAGVSQQVSAVLTDPEDGAPIAGELVTFQAAGATASATTDATGTATAALTISTQAPLGPATLSAAFAGDAFLLPSSASAPVVAYVPSSFVVWGGNATPLHLGDTVNVWGSQWEKQVTGGDYQAHGAFKGFADYVTAFAVCEAGAHTGRAPLLDNKCWSTKPGNSNPPATVPAYIGVIVSNAIDKSGSRIFGNIAGTVIVKVDASCFKPDPGHQIFGTLVGNIDGATLPPPPTLVAVQSQPATALPGQPFAVTLDLVAGSSGPAANVTASEHFQGSTPAAGSAVIGTVTSAQHSIRTFNQTAPAVPARAAGETSAAYQSRLGAADGTPLSATTAVTFTDSLDTAQPAVTARSFGLLSLPRLSLALTGAPCVGPGSVIAYQLVISNLGSAGSTGATAVVTFADDSTATLPIADLVPGATATVTASWTVPVLAPKAAGESNDAYLARLLLSDGVTLTAKASVTWRDARGGAYGAVDQSFSSVERVPALQVGTPDPGTFLPAQHKTLAFNVTDRGTGTAPAATLRLTDPDGTIAPGPTFSLRALQSEAETVNATAPALLGKQGSETDFDYLGRLASMDNTPLTFGWSLGWSDLQGNAYGPEAGTLTGAEVLPVVAISLGAPGGAASGDTLTYTVALANQGHADAVPSVVVVLPDGSTRTPAFAPVAASGTASATLTYVVPASFPGGNLSASAQLTWQDAAGNQYGPVASSATTHVTHPNLPPVVSAGPAQTIRLPATAALAGTVTDDGFPTPPTLNIAWSVVAGPGNVSFANASAPQTVATFSAPGTYQLRLTASDGQLSASSDVTITVQSGNAVTAHIVLAPAASGPIVTGSLQTLTASITDGGGTPIAGQPLQFAISGPNASSSGSATSNAAGVATFVYAGAIAGTDTLVASATISGQTFSSNSATVAWLTPVQQVSTISVRGRFFASNGAGPFVTLPTATPAFERFFPTIDFNPPSGTIPGNTSNIGVFSRPMADVTTDLNGNFTGTIVAQGNGHQAGAGDLFNFQAVFTSSFVVGSAGDVRFDFFSDDGFIFSVGNGASYVSGPRLNVPADGLSPFERLPVMGAYNQATAPVANSITVHFPSAGIYPYEVDYSECCGGQLAITMAASSNGGHGVPPAGNLILTPGTPAAKLAGTAQAFTVTAVDASNLAQANVDVTLAVTGPNARNLTARTDGQGRATFTYLGATQGTDELQARATFSNSPAFSNVVDQAWQFNPNEPTIAQPATPAQTSVSGTSVPLSVRAGDAAGEPGLTYTWSATGPGTVIFTPNGTNAAKDTTANFTAAGDYTISVTITDPSGFANVSAVALSVHSTLTSVSIAPSAATVSIGVPAQFAATVVDQFGLPVATPLGYQWSATGAGGAVFITPTAAATGATFDTVGSYQVSVAVSDGTLTISASVPVSAQVVNQPPVVSAGPGGTLVQPANTFALHGSASDDGLPVGSALTVTWSRVSGSTAVSFASLHQAATTATFSDVGVYVLRLTASDGQLSSSADITVTVLPPAGAPPTVALTNPLDGSTLSGPTQVSGSVSDGFWTLAYVQGGASGAAPIVFGSGNGAASGALGTFDPTLLLNGAYNLVLTATTDQGATSTSIGVTVQGKQKVGLFSLSFQDMKVALGGVPIRFTRTYDSRNKAQGELGIGWKLALDDVRVEKTQPVGQFWQETQRPIFFFSEFCLEPTKAAQVAITFGDGRTFKFDAAADLGGGNSCSVLFPALFGNIVFTPEPGTVGALVAIDDASFQVSGGPVGPVTLLSQSTFDTIDPRRFQLTTGEGTVYVLNQDTGIESITDRNGNSLAFGAGGIVSSNGPGVPYTRDAQGRITSITDPNGAVLRYAYDANGDLASSTTRTGDTTTYQYDDFHGLLKVTSPSGASPIRNDYDASGRLIQVTDALGGVIRYAYDLANNTTTITDRNGHSTSMTYDANGFVVAQTNALGHTTRRTFDAIGNRLSETDPLGGVTRWTFDASNRITSKTDANGGTTSYTFNQFGQALTTTDPLGRVTTHTYDARGNLTNIVDGDGKATTYVHDSTGHVTSSTNPAGATVALAYDANGNVSQFTDGTGAAISYGYDANGTRTSRSVTRTTPQGPQTLTTTYVYDASGRQTALVNPDGTTRRTEYDVDSRKSADVDELGNRTTYHYDDDGHLIEKDYPDGRKQLTSYDANGNRASTTDRGGRVTTYAYDAANRLTSTTNPDGTTRQTSYDAANRRVADANENGSAASVTYDAVGNVTQISSAGGAIAFGYDLAGNATSTTDGNGNATQAAYDSLGRILQVTAPDSTSITYTYSGAGSGSSPTRDWPPLTVVDQAGVATRFAYDGNGKPTQVIDGAGNFTAYAYDEAGNRVSVTDANNHTTKFEYDARGREVKRTLPSGRLETRAYDVAGHLVAKTDFDGNTTTYAYDAAGRLLTKTPDQRLGQATVRFTYTPGGRRATMADATGTTAWTYDARDRVIAKAGPFGTLFFTYDGAGYRRTLRSDDPAGISVDYTRDAADQLVRVADRGLATQLTYDNTGKLTALQFPNGVSTALHYNSLQRVTSMSTLRGPQLLASYAYAFQPTGVRSSQTEGSGRAVQWTHDALSRLTGESITGDPSGINGSISYGWDPAGNRLSRTSTVAPIAAQSSTYDVDDRLNSDSCDDDGSVLSANGTNYSYDFESRLTTASGGVTLRYDGLGNLVSKTAGGVTTTFLVDDVDPLQPAHIVEERVASLVLRSYVFGKQPIAMREASGVHYMHADARQDVRLLTDASGNVTDTYDFDAFGNALHTSGTTANAMRYRGERQDPDLGFTYLRERWLRNDAGRFLTRDAIFDGNSSRPLSFHKYLYASGNPVDRIDPSGRQDLIEEGEAVALSEVLLESGLFAGLEAGTAASLFEVDFVLTVVEEEAVAAAAEQGAAEGTIGLWNSRAFIQSSEELLRLNVQNWTLVANRAFLDAAIARGAIFQILSDISAEAVLSEEYGFSVFGRELAYLADAGYKILGNLLLP